MSIKLNQDANLFIKKRCFVFLIIVLYFYSTDISFAQSLSGIEIGSHISATNNIGTPPIAKEQSGPVNIFKWELADSNYLSVTSHRNTGNIIYIELDWNGSTSGVLTDFPGFLFGKTTQKQVTDKLGSLGFYYVNRGMAASINGDTVGFNSYEISNKNVIITFMTTLKISPGMNKNNISNYMYLTGIIITLDQYLNNLWGEKKIYDPNYRPISINLLQPYPSNSTQQNNNTDSSACQRFPNLCK